MVLRRYVLGWLAVMMVASFRPCGCSAEVDRGPRMRILTKQMKAETLTLPSNATSIRENIVDNFSCENRTYGFYADVDNDCQIFHVCLPVMLPAQKERTFKWSFICPSETSFDQELLTCVPEGFSSFDCQEAPNYYDVNDQFGDKEVEEETADPGQAPENEQPDKMDNEQPEKLENAPPPPQQQEQDQKEPQTEMKKRRRPPVNKDHNKIA